MISNLNKVANLYYLGFINYKRRYAVGYEMYGLYEYIEVLFGDRDKEVVETFGLGYAESRMFSKDFTERHISERRFLMEHDLVREKSSYNYSDYFNMRLMYPIQDVTGTVVGFTGRTLSKETKSKYLLSSSKSGFIKREALYNIHRAIKEPEGVTNIYVTEGTTDAIALWLCGYKNVVALLGSEISRNQIGILKQHTNKITLVFDGDSAGYKATVKAYNRCKRNGLDCDIIPTPYGYDPHAYWKEHSDLSFMGFKYTMEDFRVAPYLSKIYDSGISGSRKLELYHKILPFLKGCTPRMIDLVIYRTAIRLGISAESIMKDIEELFPGTRDKILEYQKEQEVNGYE